MISDNFIGPHGASILGKELTKLKQLKHLTVSLSGNGSLLGSGAANFVKEICSL